MKPSSLIFIVAFGGSCVSADPLYEIEQTVARQGFDGKTCWQFILEIGLTNRI